MNKYIYEHITGNGHNYMVHNTIQHHHIIYQVSNMNGYVNMNNINHIAVTNGNNITDSSIFTIQNEPTIDSTKSNASTINGIDSENNLKLIMI